jgi:hypothetical protein
MPGLVRYGHEIHHGEGAHDDAAGFRRTSAKNSWSPPSSRRSAPLDGPLRLQEECPPGQVKSRVANSDCSALGDRRDIGYTLLGGAPVPIAAPGHCRRRFSAPAPRAWVEKKYRNFNNVRVRCFIPGGAPFIARTGPVGCGAKSIPHCEIERETLCSVGVMHCCERRGWQPPACWWPCLGVALPRRSASRFKAARSTPHCGRKSRPGKYPAWLRWPRMKRRWSIKARSASAA